MQEHQYHNFIYELSKITNRLDKIIKLLEIKDDPNRKLTEEEAKKEYYPLLEPTQFDQARWNW